MSDNFLTFYLFLRSAMLLALIFILPIFAIRAQPYTDHIAANLILENCALPCFMGIRPGETTLGRAMSILNEHEWLASDALPVSLSEAIFFNAAIPRTDLHLRWSAAAPAWIDKTQSGDLTLAGRLVSSMSIATHFTLGEAILALGLPDDSRFDMIAGSQFRYTARYNQEGLVFVVRGRCPSWRNVHLPVQILFRSDYPRLSETGVSVC